MIDQVKSALVDIETFKTMDMFDQAMVEGMIQKLKAHKAILREIYHSACTKYMEMKDEIERVYIDNYRSYRGKMSQKDAEMEAKFDTLKQREEKTVWQGQKDKCKALVEDIEDCIIELQIAKRDNFNQIKHG